MIAVVPWTTGFVTARIFSPNCDRDSFSSFCKAFARPPTEVDTVSKFFAAVPALFAEAAILAWSFSNPAPAEGAIADTASTEPKSFTRFSAVSFPLALSCPRIPDKPIVLRAWASKDMPNSLASWEASELGFKVDAIACLNPEKVCSAGTPDEVAVAINPFNSSRLTPAWAARGAILAICPEYSSIVIIPFCCTDENLSTVAPASSAPKLYALRVATNALVTLSVSENPPTAPTVAALRTLAESPDFVKPPESAV